MRLGLPLFQLHPHRRGCTGYTLSIIRYLTNAAPTAVLSVAHDLAPNDKLVDKRTTAVLALPNDVTAELMCDLGLPPQLGFIPAMPDIRAVVQCEGGELELFNFAAPVIYHRIDVRPRGGAARREKVYAREGAAEQEWWSTCVLMSVSCESDN